MPQDGCPPANVLQDYLNQSLDPQPDDPIAVHIASCPVCRQALERAADSTEAERWRQLWETRRGSQIASHERRATTDRDFAEEAPTVPVVVEGFEILGVLGRGGSGIVYKARQVKLDRLVALKMLSAGAHASRGAIARLRAESSTIARFRHPRVVMIHDVGEHQGVPYLCLEYVEGGSLADRLDGKPLPVLAAASLAAALARVVHDAHDRGIIHRDLKPANVLLDGPHGGPLEPDMLKLTDFGLAKRIDGDGSASSVSSQMIMGTPSYMAPELAMARTKATGPSVDIYGLGAILYEMLTGNPPFRGNSPMETVFEVVSREPVPPSRLNDQVPKTLEAICLKCLEKDPAKRYASGANLAEVLERFASEPPKVDQCRLPEARPFASRRIAVCAAGFALGIIACVSLFMINPGYRTSTTASVSGQVLRYTGPGDRCVVQGETFDEEGKIELSPAITMTGARTKQITFDLNNREHSRYVDQELTHNARIWDELTHGIRYWGPKDDQDWFEVVYKFELGFPIRAACLFADIDLFGVGSSGLLEVSIDPGQGWSSVVQGRCVYPNCAPTDISKIVRGSRCLYVRGRMRGRNDHAGSALAQFLRTSTLPDGHLDQKASRVFELRAYDRDVPIVTAILRFDDGWSRQLWIRDDGSFDITRKMLDSGKYAATIELKADTILPLTRKFDLWVNSTGWDVKVSPSLKEVPEGEHFRSAGKLVGVAHEPLSGVVDYGDGSGEQELAVESDASFRLDHLYRATGRYATRVTIRDQSGHIATGLPICNVVPRMQ